MKKDDRVYLRHVLDAIEQIETYAAGVSRQLFLDTRLLQDAVSRQLEIMGEACRNLSEPLRLAHPGSTLGADHRPEKSPDSRLFQRKLPNCLGGN